MYLPGATGMMIWLVYERQATAIQVPVPVVVQEAIDAQWSRLTSVERYDAFIERLAHHVVVGVDRALDSDLQAPSKQQIESATAIARLLRVPLPADALRTKGDIGAFLDTHACAALQGQSETKPAILGPRPTS